MSCLPVRWMRRPGLPVRLALLVMVALASIALRNIQAQQSRGVFVTPIPNAPFTGSVNVERSFLQPAGTMVTLHSMRTIARDSQGRIYNEVRPLVPAGVSATQPIVMIHIYDPVTRISSMLYPQQRTFRVSAVNHPPSTDTPQPYASPSGNALPQSEFSKEEDLGTRTIAGLPVHGVRETQIIPADASGSGKEILIIDDYWYSGDLRINLLVSHNDPRTGSSSTTVTQLTRTEPDASLFGVPADYQPAGIPVAAH
jgi:hypothetical protein